MKITDVIRSVLDIIDSSEQTEHVNQDYMPEHGDDEIARMKELIGEPEVQYSNSPDELYADIKKVTVDAGGGLNGPKHPGNIRTTNFPMYPNLQQK